MVVKIKNTDGAVVPANATSGSAGYDILSTSDPKIHGEFVEFGGQKYYSRIDYVEYSTGIFLEPEKGHHILIHPRSSVSKYNLVLKNSIGLSDFDYRGEIFLRFAYTIQPEDLVIVNPQAKTAFLSKSYATINFDKIYKKGDKIGQLVAEKTEWMDFAPVNELTETQRGTGGFGSTDDAQIN